MKFKYNLRQKSLDDFFMLVGSVANCNCLCNKEKGEYYRRNILLSCSLFVTPQGFKPWTFRTGI